jgi:hypothetical protein
MAPVRKMYVAPRGDRHTLKGDRHTLRGQTSLLVVGIRKYYSPTESIINFQNETFIFPNDGQENISSIQNYQGLSFTCHF